MWAYVDTVLGLANTHTQIQSTTSANTTCNTQHVTQHLHIYTTQHACNHTFTNIQSCFTYVGTHMPTHLTTKYKTACLIWHSVHIQSACYTPSGIINLLCLEAIPFPQTHPICLALGACGANMQPHAQWCTLWWGWVVAVGGVQGRVSNINSKL
jgi:hypothetical protein